MNFDKFFDKHPRNSKKKQIYSIKNAIFSLKLYFKIQAHYVRNYKYT